MDDSTARQLSAINARFYARRAADFSASREGPWPGWTRLLDVLGSEGFPPDARVLDVGCGNARLGRFLAAARPALRYTGLDACRELMAIARTRGELGPAPELLRHDLVADDLVQTLGGRRFDLVACFGLLHHVPGAERRRRLLETLLEHLTPNGLLAVTCWRAAQFERFRDKILPWEHAEPRVDPSLLEVGDHLLPFGDEDGTRYVHFADEGETEALLHAIGVRLVARWQADGRGDALNQYLLVRGAAPAASRVPAD